MRFRTITIILTYKKSREINSQILKTTQLTSNARPGQVGRFRHFGLQDLIDKEDPADFCDPDPPELREVPIQRR